ncbi:MAG: hypothetical protein IT457_16270 [Planctomycetes bacterium]|nr:hypothetical protein [Planctomycetota bacterium]
MGLFRRRPRPISSRARTSRTARGCLGGFLVLWGLGFGGGGIALIASATESGQVDVGALTIGAVLASIGCGVLVLGLLVWSGRIGQGGNDVTLTGVVPTGAPPRPNLPGPIVLRPQRNRGCLLAVLLPFSLGWLGVLSFAAFHAGALEFGGSVMLAIFGAIALGLLVSCGYLILAMTNPSAELVLDLEEVPIGESVDLPWRLIGSTSRLSTLTIELVGREEATYSRGTNRVTDREEFHRSTLLRVDLGGLDARGTLRLRMPDNAVPSFRARSNQLVWLLRFSAPIRRWPDVKDEVILPVGPARRAGGPS